MASSSNLWLHGLLALGVLCGCDCGEEAPIGGTDAGSVVDGDAGAKGDGGTSSDGGRADAASGQDAGASDAGASDAGGADAGADSDGGGAGSDGGGASDGGPGRDGGGAGSDGGGNTDGGSTGGDGGPDGGTTGSDGGGGGGDGGLTDAGAGLDAGVSDGAVSDAGPNPDPRQILARPFGRVSPGGGAGVDTDLAGNVYVVGSSSSYTDAFGTTTHARLGATDAFLASFAPNAQPRWSRRDGVTGGTVDTEGLGLRVGPDGHLYVVGYTDGPLNLGGGALAAPHPGAVWVASFTTGGAHRWSRSVPGAFDRIRLAVGPNRVYVAAELDGSYDFAGSTHATAGGADVVLLAYDAAGAEQWSRRITSVDPTIMPPQPRGDSYRDGSLAANPNGVWILGESSHGHLDLGSGPIAVPSIGRSYLVSFDPAGQNPLAQPMNLRDVKSMDVDDAGRMFVGSRVGVTDASMHLTYFELSARTPARRWSLSFNQGGERNVFAVRIGAAGHAHFAGYFRDRLELGGRGLLWAPTANGFGLFLATFDISANLLRSHVFEFGIAEDLAVDPWDRDYVTGAYGGTPDFGDGAMPAPLPSGSQAYFLLRYGN